MKSRVYVETSVVSFLAARPSSDIVAAARQELTRSWWDTQRSVFDLVTSQAVIDEARAGDPEAAERRAKILNSIPVVEISNEAIDLARQLQSAMRLSPKGAVDALHIAVATINGMQYLLTWNCRHIANATLRPTIESVCRSAGFEPPIICTPEELLNA
jgi:predicted nucleic acid-binding protein